MSIKTERIVLIRSVFMLFVLRGADVADEGVGDFVGFQANLTAVGAAVAGVGVSFDGIENAVLIFQN